ncbi:synaptotagmin-like protein 1 isoform X2 [Oncorhynchus mykiss]|uniref:synaptotagmin-like protein 1 isoform X2 n=1 Tax=Oncorhynchus mykiss TaxID=8022 RepID=UPI001877C2E2|nr:synaptotagmin-like protein 1 isoform X2 [Oncorhynchus mykiss]
MITRVCQPLQTLSSNRLCLDFSDTKTFPGENVHQFWTSLMTLQQKEANPVRLRLLSGAWFHEERSKRYRDTKDGVDIVQASIRGRKPRTDLSVSGVFKGQTEDAPPTNNNDPSSQIEDDKRSYRSPPTARPRPRPRPRSPNPDPDPGAQTQTQTQEPKPRPRPRPRSPNPQDTDSVSSVVTEADLTLLRPGLSISTLSLQSNYTLSGSMMSLFSSGEFGAVEVKGRVLFSLDYDTQREELQVKVCRCEGLVAARKNHSDPYAKAYLLPDKSSHSKKKTTVKRKTLNPVFDQTLKYKISVSEVRGRTLNLSVWHAASLGRNLFLGEVELELAHWDWTHTDPDWYKLQPRLQCSPESISSRGNIMLSIKFTPAGSEGGGLPPSGEIHIWLRQAQGLLSTKGGAIDSFVESYVLPDAGRSSGQKTRVVKRSVSPIYNHTMVYEGFKPADLREACTELTVWHREGIKTHLLGGVRLSPGTGLSYGAAVCWMDSTEEEVTMWTSMILNPSHWIDTTLPIRTNLVNRQN